MAGVTYAIVFKGEILPDHQIISVKAHVAKMMKASPELMAKLFSGNPVVIKRTADKTEALKYGQAFKKIGAQVSIRAIKDKGAVAARKAAAPAAPATPSASAPNAPAPSAAAPAPAAADDGFTLKENVGNLFEPADAPEPVDVDISAMSLAENDETPLAPPREVEAVEVNLEGIEVGDMDDTPLADPSAEVARVDAPDFGLDEPGAVLETLKEDVEEVNPDTSGITLALTGSDLLNEDEKDNAPPPPPPDTSKINLVPNFDVG